MKKSIIASLHAFALLTAVLLSSGQFNLAHACGENGTCDHAEHGKSCSDHEGATCQKHKKHKDMGSKNQHSKEAGAKEQTDTSSATPSKK